MSVVIGEHTLATEDYVLSDNDDNDSKRLTVINAITSKGNHDDN